MPTHSQSKEAVAAAKVVAGSEAEALVAANSLRELSLDEAVSQAVKGEATLLYRQLAANVGNATARQEAMVRAAALAARIT
jgi:hypothetical protein